MFWLATNIPLLAEEGWLRGQSRSREATFSRADGVVSSARLISLAGLTTPSAPSLRSAHPPLLCEEGIGVRSITSSARHSRLPHEIRQERAYLQALSRRPQSCRWIRDLSVFEAEDSQR